VLQIIDSTVKEGQFAVFHDEQKEMTVKMVKDLERWQQWIASSLQFSAGK